MVLNESLRAAVPEQKTPAGLPLGIKMPGARRMGGRV